MADTTTIITGVSEGAFDKAFTGLPEWASEETLTAIENILKSMLKLQKVSLAQLMKSAGGTGTALDEKDLDNLNTTIKDLVKNTKSAVEEGKKRKKQQKEDDDDDKVTKKQRRARDELMIKGSQALQAAGLKILTIQKQYFKTSHDLFKSGVNLVDSQTEGATSMTSLQNMVSLTGLRLEQFQAVVEKYSASVNAVGINKFAKTLNQAIPKMNELGFSSEETADLFGSMIEAESNYVDVRNRSQKDAVDDLEKFAKTMNKLSLLTGQSTTKLTQNNEVLSKSSEAWVAAARLGPDAAKRLTALASTFEDAGIQDMIMKFGSSISAVNEDVFQSLNTAGLGQEVNEFKETFQLLARGTISEVEARKRATDLSLRVQQNLAKVEGIEAQRIGKNPEAVAAIRMMAGFSSAGYKTSTATEKLNEEATKAAASLARFTTELDRIHSLPQRTFELLESQVDLASKGMGYFADVITWLTDLVSPVARSWIGVGVEIAGVLGTLFVTYKKGMAVLDMVSKTGWSLNGVFGWLGRVMAGFATVISDIVAGFIWLINPVTKLIAAAAAGAALGTVLYNIISDFNWFLNAMDTLFSTLDYVFQYIPGMSEGAKERITSRNTTPAPSTIQGPSVVNIPAAGEQSKPPAAPSTAAGTPEATTGNAGENTMLSIQNSILSQLLESSKNAIAINRDMLKYIKASV